MNRLSVSGESAQIGSLLCRTIGRDTLSVPVDGDLADSQELAMANFVVGFLTGGAADTALSSGERPSGAFRDSSSAAYKPVTGFVHRLLGSLRFGKKENSFGSS